MVELRRIELLLKLVFLLLLHLLLVLDDGLLLDLVLGLLLFLVLSNETTDALLLARLDDIWHNRCLLAELPHTEADLSFLGHLVTLALRRLIPAAFSFLNFDHFVCETIVIDVILPYHMS